MFSLGMNSGESVPTLYNITDASMILEMPQYETYCFEQTWNLLCGRIILADTAQLSGGCATGNDTHPGDLSMYTEINCCVYIMSTICMLRC